MKERKSAVVMVRLTELQKSELDSLAGKAGVPPSSYLRDLLIAESVKAHEERLANA